MLGISEQTFDSLERVVLSNWLKRICPRVIADRPDWAREAGIDRIRETCLRIEAFTKIHNISTDLNFWKLLDLVIAVPHALDQLSPYQQFAIGRQGFSEDLRVSRFVADARQGGVLHMVDLG